MKFYRRFRAMLLVVTLVINAMPFMTTAEEIESDNAIDVETLEVDNIVDEAGEISLDLPLLEEDAILEYGTLEDDGIVVETVPNTKHENQIEPEYVYSLHKGEALLSAIFEAVKLPIDLLSVKDIGFTDTEAVYLVNVAPVDDDYIISALVDFDEVELAVQCEEALYAIRLVDGKAKEDIKTESDEITVDAPTDLVGQDVVEELAYEPAPYSTVTPVEEEPIQVSTEEPANEKSAVEQTEELAREEPAEETADTRTNCWRSTITITARLGITSPLKARWQGMTPYTQRWFRKRAARRPPSPTSPTTRREA